jgi:hypothetical protein
MPSQTPFFHAFEPLLFGRPTRAALERLSKVDSLQELYAICGDLFPQRLLSPSEKGINGRRRSSPAQVAFWASVWQVLSPGSSCRKTVRKMEAWWRWSQRRAKRALSPSAYYQARARLDSQTLKLIHGTMWSMPDTAPNQKRWPQRCRRRPAVGVRDSNTPSPASPQRSPRTSRGRAFKRIRHQRARPLPTLFARLDRGRGARGLSR